MKANTIYCSFCRKSAEQVKKLVADPAGKIYICDECIKRCSKIVSEEPKTAK